jgi:hypothetical protein
MITNILRKYELNGSRVGWNDKVGAIERKNSVTYQIIRRGSQMEELNRIPLRKKDGTISGYARVSPEDYEWLSKHAWCMPKGYAMTTIKNRTVQMNRLIMSKMLGKDVPSDLYVDHKDTDPLNNERNNLRLATALQNSLNKRKRENTTSAFFGVDYRKTISKFRALITIDGESKHIGYYETEEMAAMAYDLAVIGTTDAEFRRRNFPLMSEEELRAVVPIKAKRTKTSKYRGVSVEGKYFVASIMVNRNQLRLLRSHDETICAKAYDAYIVAQRLARPLNFPENYPDFVPDRLIQTEKEDIDENTVRLHIRNALASNVLVDAGDYEKIKHYICYIDSEGYVRITIGVKTLGLHRFVMCVGNPAIEVDHKSGDKFDNRKANLRESNVRQNGRNKRKRSGCTSQFIGVHKTKSGSFVGTVKNEDYTKTARTFKSEEYAARWRDWVILTTMPNATFKLNFEWIEEDKALWKDTLGL